MPRPRDKGIQLWFSVANASFREGGTACDDRRHGHVERIKNYVSVRDLKGGVKVYHKDKRAERKARKAARLAAAAARGAAAVAMYARV